MPQGGHVDRIGSACGSAKHATDGGDLDEPNTRRRVRRAVEKGRRSRGVSLPADLFAAVIATLPPREDRLTMSFSAVTPNTLDGGSDVTVHATGPVGQMVTYPRAGRA